MCRYLFGQNDFVLFFRFGKTFNVSLSEMTGGNNCSTSDHPYCRLRYRTQDYGHTIQRFPSVSSEFPPESDREGHFI